MSRIVGIQGRPTTTQRIARTQWDSEKRRINAISERSREYATDRDGYRRRAADGRRIYQVVARPVCFLPFAQQVKQFGGLASACFYNNCTSKSDYSLPRRPFSADVKTTKRKMVFISISFIKSNFM